MRGLERVGGGDINEAYRVQFEDESFGFVKTRADVAPGEYAAEAAALRWLGEPGALRVPEVLGVGESVLVLDWVDEGVGAASRRRSGRAWPRSTRRAPTTSARRRRGAATARGGEARGGEARGGRREGAEARGGEARAVRREAVR